MDNAERKVFWDTLCSLDGKNAEADSESIRKTIRTPQYLYRYRDVNVKNIEALRQNKMYFSSANYFDDPFDTFLQIDLDRIKEEFESNFSSPEKLQGFITAFKNIVGSSLNDRFNIDSLNAEGMHTLLSQGLVDNFLNYVADLRNELKKDTWSVCFSENGFNETLWLKYANQHKGFALMYDLYADDKLLCGKHEKCLKCGVSNIGTPLYPIYYSDEKYNATNLAKYIVMKKFEELVPDVKLTELFASELGNLTWERERTTLIKKKCHEHDEEWRMILPGTMKPPIMREWIPHGIILGLRMDTREENLVVSIARQAGIEHIYKSGIDKNGDLNASKVIFREDK